MIKQQELIRRVTGKNRLSNIMLCCKIVLDLIPQVLLIHMIGLYFAASLTREQILWECGAMLLCFIGKAVCACSAIWTAHKAAYTCLTDLRLKIIRHLKKMSLGFFQERKTGDLTNIVQHDVEQVEGHLAHGLPETVSATILPAVVFLVMLLVDWRLALVMVVGLPLMWITKKVSAPLWTKNFKIYADSVTRMQENVMEYVSNISVIKAFGKEESKTEKTIQSAKDYDYWVKKSMASISVPREASEMFQSIKYEDKREVFGLKIHSFSTLDRIKKYDGSDNEENAEKPYSIEVGEIERTINLYAIATTKFQVAV